MNKGLVSLLLGMVFILGTGCSRLDFAFRWADTYIASKVDDYFDISSQQSKELKNDIQKDLQAIRTEVLPTWIDRLQGLQKEVNEGPIKQDRVAFYFDSFMNDVEQINTRFADTAVDFIATTKPGQIDHFVKAFHEKNAEDLKKYTDSGKKQYRDKYIEWFEMFVGSLNSDQKKMIDENLAASPYPLEMKVKNKEHVFAKFITHRESPDDMKKFVRDYYSNPTQYDLPEYRETMNSWKKNMQTLVTNVLSTLTDRQKTALRENLSEKTAQLQKIALRN